MPERRKRQMARHDSTTCIEKTAPETAPIPAPQTKPLSDASPRIAPVIAPINEPTAAKKLVKGFRQRLLLGNREEKKNRGRKLT